MSLLKTSETYKPFKYPWSVELSKKHEEIHWIEDEAELSEDVQDWKTKLTDSEKEFITHVLRLFTQSDVQVGENYHELLIPKFKNNEVRNMLSSFAAREAVHQRAYALLNDTLGLPDEDFHKFLEYKEMADKIDFMKEGETNSHTGLALALAQSVFNEGMSVFASFVMLLNFQRFGKMKGMATIVEWSIRDETIHTRNSSSSAPSATSIRVLLQMISKRPYTTCSVLAWHSRTRLSTMLTRWVWSKVLMRVKLSNTSATLLTDVSYSWGLRVTGKLRRTRSLG